MYLTDLVSAGEMVKYRKTIPSPEFQEEQNKRLGGIFEEYGTILSFESNRHGWSEEEFVYALGHALIAIRAIDYLIYKVTEKTQ